MGFLSGIVNSIKEGAAASKFDTFRALSDMAGKFDQAFSSCREYQGIVVLLRQNKSELKQYMGDLYPNSSDQSTFAILHNMIWMYISTFQPDKSLVLKEIAASNKNSYEMYTKNAKRPYRLSDLSPKSRVFLLSLPRGKRQLANHIILHVVMEDLDEIEAVSKPLYMNVLQYT